MSDLLITALMDDKGPWLEERCSGLLRSFRSVAKDELKVCQ